MSSSESPIEVSEPNTATIQILESTMGLTFLVFLVDVIHDFINNIIRHS